jgi:hypothetical protein
MPHVSEVRTTSHDRHDLMLVAALAAGDLAATDRDQAIALTRSCSDCALVHDDLVAIARATATTPPPIASPRRDFRLTPEDAARIRGGAWRRLVAALGAPGRATLRPLGVGLTTLGLVGLLIGNVQLTPGAASPSSTVAAPATGPGVAREQADGAVKAAASAAAALNAESSGPDTLGAGSAASAPAASSGDTAGEPMGSSGSTGGVAALPANSGSTGGKATASDDRTFDQGGGLMSQETVVDASRPLNALFTLSVALGLGLLVISRLRSRPVR